MSNDINHIILSGNVGHVPEIINISDTILAKLMVATNKRWKHDGKSYAKAEWHTVMFSGKLAESVREYVHKGDKLLLQGELCYKQWQDKNGANHISSEVRAKEFTILRSNKDAEELAPPAMSEQESQEIAETSLQAM